MGLGIRTVPEITLLSMNLGSDMAFGVPDGQVPEVEGGDRTSDKEVGEEEGGSWRGHPRPYPEAKDGP